MGNRCVVEPALRVFTQSAKQTVGFENEGQRGPGVLLLHDRHGAMHSGTEICERVLNLKPEELM